MAGIDVIAKAYGVMADQQQLEVNYAFRSMVRMFQKLLGILSVHTFTDSITTSIYTYT